MSFGKSVLASFLGTLLAFVAAVVLFILLMVGLVAASLGEEKSALKEMSVLRIKMNQPVLERGNEEGLNFDFNSFAKKENLYLDLLKKDLSKAMTDEHIAGIMLEMGGISGAPATLKDVRDLIQMFKLSGKWVIAYGENLTQGDYYIASAASNVYLYPTGMLEWKGINGESMFFKNLLDDLEIQAQVIRGRDNKYKSAVEPFIYNHLSEPNKEQLNLMFNQIWNEMVNNISQSRNVSAEKINLAATELRYMKPNLAVEDHFIDGLKYYDEVVSMINEKLGKSLTDKTPFVDYEDYRSSNKELSLDLESGNDYIAVVYAVGEIQQGKGSDEVIGSDRIAAALRKARLDEHAKAIVLRVNSPGGSALASDIIWRETELIKNAGKKLVVSMGDYAASGGYYISCGADQIFANPNTITGSIGVFGIVPNLQTFLDHKLGITIDRVETHPHADFFSITKPFDEMELAKMNEMVVGIYDDFLSRVSNGRGMTVAQVDSIARGRVWTGTEAKKIGLVDQLGSLQDAIDFAANAVGMTKENVVIKTLPKMEDPITELLGGVAEAKQNILLKEVTGDHYQEVATLRSLIARPGVYTRLPFVLEVK
jgi:protease-4